MNEFFPTVGLMINILLGIFISAFLAEMFFYLFFFSQTGKKKKKKKVSKNSLPPVSVIICARNEEENLRKYLPLVLEQEYPSFEVIVVNDCSDDNTHELLNNLLSEYSNLKVTAIKKDPRFTHNKKLALTIGIKAASNELLLLTDADCYPVSKYWIREMMINYSEKTDIILGYGGYETRPGLLNKLIRFEAVFTAMQYMGLAERRIPYMGVGRNLSYRKSLFFLNKGFASHLHLNSGDDDLFISEIATPSNTCVETHPDSFTRSVPASDVTSWFRQRKRHFTTGIYYKSTIKALLGGEYLLRSLFNISFILLLVLGSFYQLFLSVYLINAVVKGIIFKIILMRLKERYLFIFSLLIEPFQPILYVCIHMVNFIERKRSRWR